MTDCPRRIAELPCSLTGVAYTAEPINPGQTTVSLRTGHGKQMPDTSSGKGFYAELTDACDGCCELVKVTSIEDDKATFTRFNERCTCFPSNSRLRYTLDSIDAIEDIVRGVGINVVDPLVYDCESRTIRIDCAKLHDMVANPCGDSNASDNVSGSSA